MQSGARTLEMKPASTGFAQISISLLAAAVTFTGILVVKPTSLAHFLWFFCLWNGVIVVFHRNDSARFAQAFLVNSAFVSVFVLVQSAVYPDTYGTTSPLAASWTDDSFFFSVVADSVPPDMFTRPSYWEYEPMFGSLVRMVTPLYVEHPLDVLFFQSGTAALLSTFTARFMIQLSRDSQLANIVFVFTMVCPFLLMNGGAIFLRDTLAAALFVYSLSCINERRLLSAAIAVALQLSVRPGTGAILMLAYPIIYFVEVRSFVGRHPMVAGTLAFVFAIAAVMISPLAIEFVASNLRLDSIGILGREVLAEQGADSSVNAIFLAIQENPFIVKLILNAAYIFLYPFLTLQPLVESSHFDLRSILLGIVVPVYSLWLNAWFFAGMFRGQPAIDRQRALSVAFVVILLLVGTYSLQTRHKTIVYPLYYLLIAIGFARATPVSRRVGYALSGILLFVQLASALR
jgi:hypothetical protein